MLKQQSAPLGRTLLPLLSKAHPRGSVHSARLPFLSHIRLESSPAQSSAPQQHSPSNASFTTSPQSRPRSSESTSEDPSSQRPNIYKQFGRPFAKVFLGAMFVYQLLYWGWEKMRLDEVREERTAELGDLERKVQEYKDRKDGKKI